MPKPKMSLRRKLAIATWGNPSEGNIYGKLTLDVSEALAYLDHVRETTGEKVTITHLVGKACAVALKQAPTLNGYIRLGEFIPHESADIAFLVALEGGTNLAKAKVCRVEHKSVVDIARELRELAGHLHGGRDVKFNKTQDPVRSLPTWLLKPTLWATGVLTSSFGMSLPALGLEAFPFGSCIVTSVGMFGVDEGFAPPTPFARVPVYVLVGAIREMPAVVDGQVVVQKQITITTTIDHRFVDGAQIGVMANAVRAVFANPWSLDGLSGRPTGGEAQGPDGAAPN